MERRPQQITRVYPHFFENRLAFLLNCEIIDLLNVSIDCTMYMYNYVPEVDSKVKIRRVSMQDYIFESENSLLELKDRLAELVLKK